MKHAKKVIIQTKGGELIGGIATEQGTAQSYRLGLRLVTLGRGKYEVRVIKRTDDGRVFVHSQPYAEIEGPKAAVGMEYKKLVKCLNEAVKKAHEEYMDLTGYDDENEEAIEDFGRGWDKVYRQSFPNFLEADALGQDTNAGLAADMLAHGFDDVKANLAIAKKATKTKLRPPDKLDVWLLRNWKTLKPLKPAERLKLVQAAKIAQVNDRMLRMRLSRLSLTMR
jgi:hypothetical protein